MNKEKYLLELERALKGRKIQDVADILLEYEQHFDCKTAEGYSEEEIANRLEAPEAIASQFALEEQGGNKEGMRWPVYIGIAFAGTFAVMTLIILYGWLIVFGVFSLTVTALAACLIGNINVAGLIPAMPYTGALILGISFMGLGVLSAIGTTYCYLYINYWIKLYLCWHRSMLKGKVCSRDTTYLPKEAFGQRIKPIAIIAAAIFGVFVIIGMVYMFAYTGFKPFWHELNWFQ